MEQARIAYDRLATDYHLMYADWRASVVSQGKVLDQVIRKALPPKPGRSVLDCSCGIGTQAIGLALRGYKVYATDLSPRAVAQAKKNAAKFKVKVATGTADFRQLAGKVPGAFDLVLSCDNSLPHLTTPQDILLAAKNIRKKLAPGGVFLLGIRDYDAFLPARPTGIGPFLMKDGKGERIYFQVWKWEKKHPVYEFRLFLLRGRGQKWKAQCVSARYRAWKRSELTALFLKAGFSSVRWLMPEKTGFKQPLAVMKAHAFHAHSAV